MKRMSNWNSQFVQMNQRVTEREKPKARRVRAMIQIEFWLIRVLGAFGKAAGKRRKLAMLTACSTINPWGKRKSNTQS